MPDFDNWRGYTRALDRDAARAAAAWERIQDEPTTIIVYRNGAAQAAQTVRLVWQQARPDEGVSATGKAAIMQLVILGVRDHPDASVSDTDLAGGDRFVHDGQQYQVVDVVTLPGEVQAYTERVT